MYQITCDGLLLHDSRSDLYKVINPICELELNKSGTLSFKIAPNHPHYGKIQKLRSEISLYQDGEWIFTGRVLNDEIDIYKFKTIEAEGILAYLLDSTQKAKIYDDGESIESFLKDVISVHNSEVDEEKQFTVGKVTIEEDEEAPRKEVGYKDTLSTLNESLIKQYKGYLILGEHKILNYVTSNDFEVNNQIIQFGRNILSMTKYLKGEEIATVIYPLGATIDNESDDTAETRLDVSECSETSDGSIERNGCFVEDTEAIAKYGRIVKCTTWNDVDDPDKLLSLAKKQLKYYKQLITTVELNAFDLHLIDVDYDAIRVAQKIHVISSNHDLNQLMIVEKMTLNISSPEKSTITISSEERSALDLGNSASKKSSANEKNIDKIQEELDNMEYATKKEVNEAFKALSEELKTV